MLYWQRKKIGKKSAQDLTSVSGYGKIAEEDVGRKKIVGMDIGDADAPRVGVSSCS